MKKIAVLLIVLSLGVLSGFPVSASAGLSKTRQAQARQGDNTIYFRYNAEKRKVVEATSSRMITSGQDLELLTSIADRTDKVRMKAVLRNISSDTTYKVAGRLVHQLWRSGKLIRTLRSQPLTVTLKPGGRVAVVFAYMLRTGEYSARTDLTTE